MNRQRLKHEAETVGAGSSVTRCLLDELHPGGQTEFGVDMGGWVCTVRGETKSGKISAIVERAAALAAKRIWRPISLTGRLNFGTLCGICPGRPSVTLRVR